MNENHAVRLFEDKTIRSLWIDEEQQWYFSVIDVVQALTGSVNPRDYWFKMKKRVHSDDGIELSTICRQLKLEAPDGKMRETDCANVKSLFRIIQSIPSPKAEPFKQWLSQVGYERILEIENPELAQERMKDLYEQKGYSKDWIDKRLRGIAIRQNLTDEWKERGIDSKRDYAILTAEISKAAFGLTPAEYKNLKGLTGNQDLRDNMGAAAHLIHGSSDNRFSITYAVKEITKDEIAGVGFIPADYDEMCAKYDPAKLNYGYNTVDGEEIYFIPNPALGLWINREKF